MILLIALGAIVIIGIATAISTDIVDKPIFTKSDNIDKKDIGFSVCGWIPWWDYNIASQEIIDNPQKFSILSPFIYELSKDLTINQKISDDQIVQASINDLDIETIPTISNNFNGEIVSEIINSVEKSDSHIDGLVNIADNFDGIEIDYEELFAEDKDAFTKFIEKLAARLHANDKKLSIALHPKTSDKGKRHATQAQDWKSLSQSADYLRIMAYDYHWSTSEPGPIAPYGWLKDITKYAQKTIPIEKRILGIGLFAYDWQAKTQNGRGLTLSEVSEIIADNNAKKMYHRIYESPYVEYNDSGIKRVIWFEDPQSFQKKLDLAKESYAGICIWKIGAIPKANYLLLE